MQFALGAFSGVKSLYARDSLARAEFGDGASGDLFAKRGGVFEPALALMLIRNSKALRAAMEKSGKWFLDRDYSQPVNALHEWVGERAGKTVQFVQNFSVERAPSGNLLISVVLPRFEDDDAPVQEVASGPRCHQLPRSDKWCW